MTVVSTQRRPESLIYAAAAAVTSLVTYIALELWKADLRVPLVYAGDALPTGAHFKTVIEEGWYEHQPRLGAPWGQFYNDFPTADNLHLVAAKVIALFTSDWAVALNTYFLIGFPLIAIAAVWFLRTCGVSASLSIAFATVFAIAPYHFYRSEAHLWLGSYYAVPLALGLLVLLLRKEPLFAKGGASKQVLAYVFSPTTRTLAWIAILATSSSYYSIFFLVLLAFTGIIVLIRDRRWSPFLAAVGVGLLTVAVMLLNMLPDLIFSWQNGANPGGLERGSGETERYAFKLSQLLLPWAGHRIGTLRGLRERYDASYLAIGEMPALGAIAAAGLLAALAIVLILAIYRRRSWDASARLTLAGSLSSLVLVSVLFATVGGFSTFISFFTSSLRGWNRMSIVIAMLSLAIGALLVEWLLERTADRRRWTPRLRVVASGVIGLVLIAVAFVDQTPHDPSAAYASTKERFDADAAYFAQLESRLSESSMVLLLPYIPFPESSGPTGFLASDQLVPYLHTAEVHWTNGGIKGRPKADWPGGLAAYETEDLAELAAASGSVGVLVQRSAYEDFGRSVEQSLQSDVSTAPFESADGVYAYYDLSDVAARLKTTADQSTLDEMALRITDPATIYPSPDFATVFAEDGGLLYAAGADRSTFSIVNDSPDRVDAEFSTTIECDSCSGTVSILIDGDEVLTEPLEANAASISGRMSVPSGTTEVEVRIVDDAGAPIPVFAMTAPALRQVPIVQFLSRLPDGD